MKTQFKTHQIGHKNEYRLRNKQGREIKFRSTLESLRLTSLLPAISKPKIKQGLKNRGSDLPGQIKNPTKLLMLSNGYVVNPVKIH